VPRAKRRALPGHESAWGEGRLIASPERECQRSALFEAKKLNRPAAAQCAVIRKQASRAAIRDSPSQDPSDRRNVR
jgi:hypothetical protein